jgi:hypothetical protein
MGYRDLDTGKVFDRLGGPNLGGPVQAITFNLKNSFGEMAARWRLLAALQAGAARRPGSGLRRAGSQLDCNLPEAMLQASKHPKPGKEESCQKNTLPAFSAGRRDHGHQDQLDAHVVNYVY